MSTLINRREYLIGSAAAAAFMVSTPVKAEPSEWLGARISGLPEAHGFPGMTAAITFPDGRVWSAAVGLSDRETGEAMTDNHVMPAGSTGKTFVAAAAVDLHLQGRLDLDQPIGEWLSERSWFGHIQHADQITPRLLLQHRSGIAEYYEREIFVERHTRRLEENPDLPFYPDELIEIGVTADPHFLPDNGFSYADTNYLLIGMIIEAIAGRSYEDQVMERLLQPHDLQDGIIAPTSRHIPNLASSYLEQEAFGVPPKAAENETMVMHPVTEWTGGGMTTRATELSRWGHIWFGDRAFPGDYHDLIREAPRGSSVINVDGQDWRYGLGCETRRSPSPRFIGHRGWYPAFISCLAYHEELDMSVALQFNQVPAAPGSYRLALELMEEAAAL